MQRCEADRSNDAMYSRLLHKSVTLGSGCRSNELKARKASYQSDTKLITSQIDWNWLLQEIASRGSKLLIYEQKT